MEETIKAKKTFASNFMKLLEYEFDEFKDKLSPVFYEFVKFKIEEIRKKQKENKKKDNRNKIGFKSGDFRTFSVQEILLDLSQEIKNNIHDEITKDLKETDEEKRKGYTFENSEDVYKTTDLHLSLVKSINNNFLKTIDNKNIEVYISRVRYLIYLSDHRFNLFNHPVCNFKYDLIFITEIFRHCIDAVSLKRPICKLCFRQIGSGENSKYNKIYCHKHKDSLNNYNLVNIKGAYEKLSDMSKRRLSAYQFVKHTNGDSISIIENSDLNQQKQRIISLSYHPCIITYNDDINNNLSNFEVTEEVLDLPDNFEEIRDRIKNRVGESGTIFKSKGFVNHIKDLTCESPKNTQLKFNQYIKVNFPLTFSNFEQELPIVNSMDQYIRALNQPEYLDNEHDPTLNFFWLIESFCLSEDILEAERDFLEEKLQEEAEAKQNKADIQKKIRDRVIQIFDGGETVIKKIKATLDDEGMPIGRQKVADIVKNHKETKSEAI